MRISEPAFAEFDGAGAGGGYLGAERVGEAESAGEGSRTCNDDVKDVVAAKNNVCSCIS